MTPKTLIKSRRTKFGGSASESESGTALPTCECILRFAGPREWCCFVGAPPPRYGYFGITCMIMNDAIIVPHGAPRQDYPGTFKTPRASCTPGSQGVRCVFYYSRDMLRVLRIKRGLCMYARGPRGLSAVWAGMLMASWCALIMAIMIGAPPRELPILLVSASKSVARAQLFEVQGTGG